MIFYRKVIYPTFIAELSIRPPNGQPPCLFPLNTRRAQFSNLPTAAVHPLLFFLLIKCTQPILPPSATCTARQIYRSAHRRHLPILPILIYGTHYKLSSQTILPPSAACPHLPRQGFANIRPRLFLYVKSTFSTFFLTRRQPKTGKSLSRNGGHKKEICNHDGALARPQFKLVAQPRNGWDRVRRYHRMSTKGSQSKKRPVDAFCREL